MTMLRSGVVSWFDRSSGSGMIAPDDGDRHVFFNFTAIPGAGYRTTDPGTAVVFEVVETRAGPVARNVQRISEAS